MTRPARIRTGHVAAVTVPSTATQLFPSPLALRAAVMVRNTHTAATLYLGFTEAETTTADGWPVRPGEVFRAELAIGAELWGISSGADINVRTMQGGA